jgi:RNA polymerase sigma-70 factor (ECF subfamily)
LKATGRSIEGGPISTAPPRLTPLRELQLVEDHRNGKAEAAGELLQAYQRRIYAVCFRMVRDNELARDLSQDAMVKVLEGLSTYDGRSKLSTWMIRVTMNCCLSELRKRKLRSHASLDAPLPGAAGLSDRSTLGGVLPVQGELSALDRVEQAEMRAIVLRALGRLDPETRALLVLRDMQDLDYQQIAEVIDAPVGTVKSRLFRARAALREAIETEMPSSSPDS